MAPISNASSVSAMEPSPQSERSTTQGTVREDRRIHMPPPTTFAPLRYRRTSSASAVLTGRT